MNTGKFYFTFNENKLYYATGQPFQEPHDVGLLLEYDKKGNPAKYPIEFTERKITHLDILGSDEPTLYISWYNKENQSETGFSTYDFKAKQEVKIHTFDPEFLEPFLDNNGYMQPEDAVSYVNTLKKKINCFIKILDVIQTEEFTTYIVTKKTPFRMPGKTSTMGGTGSPGGSRVGYPGQNMNHSGDIMYLTFDNEGELVLQAKSERYLNLNYFGGVASYFSNNEIHTLYYDMIPRKEQKIKAGFKFLQNFQLHQSIYSLETGEFKDNMVINHSPEGPHPALFFMESNMIVKGNMVCMTFGNGDEQMAKVKF